MPLNTFLRPQGALRGPRDPFSSYLGPLGAQGAPRASLWEPPYSPSWGPRALGPGPRALGPFEFRSETTNPEENHTLEPSGWVPESKISIFSVENLENLSKTRKITNIVFFLKMCSSFLPGPEPPGRGPRGPGGLPMGAHGSCYSARD